jgi:hypothetical protein
LSFSRVVLIALLPAIHDKHPPLHDDDSER